MRICVVGGFAPSLVNFRGALLEALVSRGHSVVAVAPSCSQTVEVEQRLRAINVRFIPFPFSRAGLNPLADLWCVFRLVWLIKALTPDYILAYTAKPVIYVGLAVRLSRKLLGRSRPLRFAALITGLGYVFTADAGADIWRRSFLRLLTKRLYREGLKASQIVMFQNPDDQLEFESLGMLSHDAKVVRIFGSGVDLDLFPPSPIVPSHSFLMLARLLVDKGVREYVQAARFVKASYPRAVFFLAGSLDPNPAGIRKQELALWVEEGIIKYLGDLHDVQPALASCRYYVLPSYREGLPRSVLEAMATGRPILTTDVPGCRETVINGVNGFLVPPHDAQALADAMLRLIEQSQPETKRMALASLQLARERYDVHKVNDVMIATMGL